MTNLFNQLANEFKGDFTYETTNKYFNVEISVSFWYQQIEVRYYKGLLLEPIKKEKYHSLTGMFGAETLENKFEQIINNLYSHNPLHNSKI